MKKFVKIERRWFPALAFLLLPFLFILGARSDQQETKIQWDISGLRIPGPASAMAQDNSLITLTGSGTFELGDPGEVTGGGTWELHDSSGVLTDSGTYEVQELVSFHFAPGLQPAGATDIIGNPADARPGLAFLRVHYSNGEGGILVVSCSFGTADGTPASVFEGITASMGFVDFWNRVAPVPGVSGNRTIFHIV